ncbi:Vitamin B12 import ATP-binding protein BtuD [Streptomyces tanashiensis]
MGRSDGTGRAEDPAGRAEDTGRADATGRPDGTGRRGAWGVIAVVLLVGVHLVRGGAGTARTRAAGRPQPAAGNFVMAPEQPPPLLTMEGITKTFPGVRALDGVDLDVAPGEVHCLLGQNGAGKSTLIKVLAGAHQPDDGRITWNGSPVRLRSPSAAVRLGIATIYQELDLVEGLSVAENVHLGHEPTTAGFVRTRAARATTTALLKRLGHPEIDPARRVGELSAAQRQIVSMARALSHDVRLIVMDEPSAALDPDEVANLFRIVADLTADGVAVVYISTAWRRSAASATASPSSRTAAPSPADCPQRPPPPARSSPS